MGGKQNPSAFNFKAKKWQGVIMKELLKSKTFYTGLAAIITGIGFMVNGSIETGAELITGGLIAIFMRHKLSK